MPIKTDPLTGARKIINTCLSLSSSQDLVILFDETTREVADILLEAANQSSVSPTAIYIPKSIQRHYTGDDALPFSTESAIRNAVGITTCLTDAQDCLSFRLKIFDVGLNAHAKIGHMPGITSEILAMADADYDQISADCELLARVLLRGQRVKLTTHAANGAEHDLMLDIGGWERPPCISGGMIRRGSWGNIPPGETFIAPVEGSASGSLVINGSLPGYPLPAGVEMVLHFQNGLLHHADTTDPRCRQYLQNTQDYAEQRGDPNWRNLAELGIGVNPAIPELTGIQLVDEKKAGTAHIALGDNTHFGGQVSSVIHDDLVTHAPTLVVDNITILERGCQKIQLSDYLEDHRMLGLPERWEIANPQIRRTGIRGEMKSNMLHREWKSGRGEEEYLQVGGVFTARRAGRVYLAIPQVGSTIEFVALAARLPDFDKHELMQNLVLLQIYELITIT